MKKLTEKLNNDKRNYPILAWYENADQSQILIISKPGQYKTISTFPSNLSKLYLDLKEMLQVQDLLESASKGDDSIHSFTINEFPESKPNWDNLKTDIKAELEKFIEIKDLQKQVLDEILNNHKYDLAASALKCIYSSILYNMITKSLDLGITEMLIIGDLTYEEGLSSVIENNLPQHMTMSFLQL